MYQETQGGPPADPGGEFAIYEEALRKQDQAPPPLDLNYLEAAASDRSKSPEQVRSHFAGVFMATSGALMPLFTGARARLEKKIADFEASAAEMREARAGMHDDVVTDTGEAVRWGRTALIRAATFGAFCISLLVMGCVNLMGTLAESEHQVFDSFIVRLSFSLLPALVLAAGWKLLGSLQRNVLAENAYWKWVTQIGLALGGIWLILTGLTIGEAAWGAAKPDDLPGGSSAGLPLGAIMVIAGVFAETMVAAGCWRAVDEELNRHRSLKVSDNPITRRRNERIESNDVRLAEATALRDSFTGRIEAIERGRDAYAERAVAALTPRWRPPTDPGGAQDAPINPRRSDGPNVLRNGQNYPEEKRA